jgi:hypothetical protein
LAVREMEEEIPSKKTIVVKKILEFPVPHSIDETLKFKQLRSLEIRNLGLISLDPLSNFLLSPFIENLDFSLNPIKAKSFTNFNKILPLSAIRYLSLAQIRLSQSTLEEL